MKEAQQKIYLIKCLKIQCCLTGSADFFAYYFGSGFTLRNMLLQNPLTFRSYLTGFS